MKALADYVHAIRLDGKNDKVYANRAFAFFSTRQFDKAITDYDGLVTKFPKEFNYVYYRGLSRASAGLFKPALEDLSACLALQPGNAEVYYNMALCWYKLNDGANAFRFMEKARIGGYSVDPSLYAIIRKMSGARNASGR